MNLCEQYNFENKLMAEVSAYENKTNRNRCVPELIEYNEEKDYLIVKYIEGKLLQK